MGLNLAFLWKSLVWTTENQSFHIKLWVNRETATAAADYVVTHL